MTKILTNDAVDAIATVYEEIMCASGVRRDIRQLAESHRAQAAEIGRVRQVVISKNVTLMEQAARIEELEPDAKEEE